MGNVATRLLSLILLLQTRPTWKASELAATLEVSERTVHRYMGMLDEVGVPIYSERGPYGGFSLLRGERLPPLLFTAEEATVLTMGANLVREVWGQTYGDAVASAVAKLDNVLPDEMRAEVSEARHSLVVGGLARRNPTLWERSLDILRHSVRDRRCVRIQYRAYAREDETDRVVEPYAVTFQMGLWYLVGYCRLRQGIGRSAWTASATPRRCPSRSRRLRGSRCASISGRPCGPRPTTRWWRGWTPASRPWSGRKATGWSSPRGRWLGRRALWRQRPGLAHGLGPQLGGRSRSSAPELVERVRLAVEELSSVCMHGSVTPCGKGAGGRSMATSL